MNPADPPFSLCIRMSFPVSTTEWTAFQTIWHVTPWNIIFMAAYGIGQAIIFSCCGFYLLLSIFFPRLISAVGDWMSTIIRHLQCGPSANLECRSEMCYARLAENTGCKKVAKNRHLGTIAQLCQAISSELRHVHINNRKIVKQQSPPHVPTIWRTSAH